MAIQKRNRRATGRDVAKLAGVTTASVSRVMNNIATVTPDVRNRVIAAANALSYRPLAVARSLSKQRLETIGLVCPSKSIDSTNYYSSCLMYGISLALSEISYHLTMGIIPCVDPKPEIQDLPFVKSYSVDGVILDLFLESHEIDEAIAAINMPSVFVNPTAYRTYNAVIPNDKASAFKATNYLIDRGHRRIGYLPCCGETTHISQPHRMTGYVQAMTQAQLCPLPYWDAPLPSLNLGSEKHLRLMAQLIREWLDKEHCTAIVTYDAVDAAFALRILYEFGLRVPDDVSIIACDYEPRLDCVTVPITSVRTDREEMGRLAVSMLMQQLNNDETNVPSVYVEGVLQERNSVRKFPE